MRAEILARMQQQGMSCELRMIDMEEIPRFQSLFFCNALSPMKIAKSLNHQHFRCSAVYRFVPSSST